MVRRERATLIVAYVLLVLVTAWSTRETNRALDRIEEDSCATAAVVIYDTVSTLAVFGGQEGVNAEMAVAVLDQVAVLADALSDQCGATFLDDIDLPPLPLGPLTDE